MSSLTVSQQVIRDHPPAPLEGHTVVVFERLRDGGEVFRAELGPLDRAPRGFLDSLGIRSQRFFGFAVTQAPEIGYSFSEHIALDDHLHEVDVTFDLSYRAASPQTIAAMRSQDPLGKVVAEIARVIGREIAALPWETVRHNFREAEAGVWASAQGRLRRHAAGFGLELCDLVLKLRVRDADIEVELGRQLTQRTRAKRQDEHELKLDEVERDNALRERELRMRQQRAELESQDQTAELVRRQREAVTGALETALEKVAGNTTTAAELREAMSLAFEAASAFRPAGTSVTGATMFGAGSPASGYLPTADSGAARLISEVLAEIENIGSSFLQKKALQSAVLRLFAELLDEEATDATVAARAERVKKIVAALQPQPSASQMKFLMSLSRYDELRLRLS